VRHLANLAALPPRKRAVMTLRVSNHGYGEIAAELGMGQEIAAELGMGQRTVERQLVRARAAVRHATREALAA
jgi:DNA-directed RNA polymerase specialized sigma24 family protein